MRSVPKSVKTITSPPATPGHTRPMKQSEHTANRALAPAKPLTPEQLEILRKLGA